MRETDAQHLLYSTIHRTLVIFAGTNFRETGVSEIFAVGESVTLAVRLKAERMYDNLSSLFQCGEKTSLVPRTLVYRNVPLLALRCRAVRASVLK